MTNYHLKLLAAILMLVDHVGVIFFPSIIGFRILGRFSFPLFILLLIEGEKYTRNFGQYCLRLLLLGIISQPIFQVLFQATRWNILFTLLVGLLCLRLVRVFPQWQLLIWLVGATTAQLLGFEYGAYGVVAIALLRTLQDTLVWWSGWTGLHLSLFWLNPVFASFQLPTIFAPLLLRLANHQRGLKARWFYLFYPLHLFALWLLRLVIENPSRLFL